MEGYFLIQANTGRAYRVVRRGFHMVVEMKTKDGPWEGVYRFEITENDEPSSALRGAIRKALYFSDDFTQLGACLSMVKEHDSRPPFSQLIAVTHLPRDAFLTARIPKPMKLDLRVRADVLAKQAQFKVTIADYLIYRLGSGGDVQ